MGIKLRIEDAGSFAQVMRELKRNGLLRDIPDEIILEADAFPMDIPLDLGKILEAAGNPVIRKAFGKKMNTVLTSYVAAIMKA